MIGSSLISFLQIVLESLDFLSQSFEFRVQARPDFALKWATAFPFFSQIRCSKLS